MTGISMIAASRIVWSPRLNDDAVNGVVHDAKAPTSTEHSNVEPASVDVNVNTCDVDAVLPGGGDVIVVSGAVTSCVHVSGPPSTPTLPARSVARNDNAYAWPSTYSGAADCVQ